MKVLAIAWTGLIRILRAREALFWMFIGPAIFMTFFGLLFKQSPARPTLVTIVNRDADDFVARALGASLARDSFEVRRADRPPPQGFGLTVPLGAADAMTKNMAVELVLHTGDEETNAERSLRFKIQRALTITYLQANPVDVPRTASDAELGERIARSERITIARKDIGIELREVTAGFQRSVPSYLVMFLFLNLLVSGAGIAEERASGKMRRIFIAPVSKREIVLGKLLTRVATGWLQMIYMLGLGVFVFGIRWAEHSWVLIGFLTLFAVASASLGLLLGTLFRDPDKAQATAIWTAILLAPLGGLWWPIEIVGPTMRRIGSLVPTGWAMEGVNSLLAFGVGAREIAPQALAIAAMLAVSLTLAARRLKP